MDAVRGLIGQPLRGELTPPARVQYEPLASADRLKWLISQMASTGPGHGGESVHARCHSIQAIEVFCVLTEAIPTFPRVTIGPVGHASPTTKTALELGKRTSDQPEETIADVGLELIRSEMSREELEQAENSLIPYALVTAAGRPDDSLNQIISAGVSARALNQRSSTGLGQTAVHVAAFHGQIHNLELLLDHGASVHLRDDFGHTALYYAMLNDHQTCVEALEKAGGHLAEFEKLAIQQTS